MAYIYIFFSPSIRAKHIHVSFSEMFTSTESFCKFFLLWNVFGKKPSAVGMSSPIGDDSPPSMGLLVLRKFFGGTVGGFLQGAISHPFDTIKSRIQPGTYPNIATCVRGTLANEGPLGLYKGVTAPMSMMGIYNAALFSCNQFFRNALTQTDPQNPAAKLPLSDGRIMLAGMMTSIPVAGVLTPCEVVKIRLQLQTQRDLANAEYRGLCDCVVKMCRQEGVMSLLHGYLPTLSTRFVGLPFYFWGNDKTRQMLLGNFDWFASAHERIQQKKPEWGDVMRNDIMFMLSGGMGGYAFWTVAYPIDTVKTRLQMSKKGSSESITSIVKEILTRHPGFFGPVKGFYKGFGACLIRSFPANASVWIGMEKTQALMARNGW